MKCRCCERMLKLRHFSSSIFSLRSMSSDSFRSLKGPFNWINNARVNPLKAIGSIDNLSPRTGISIADVPVSGQEEVDRAVQAAKDAFGSWKSLSGADRGRILLKTAELVRQNVEELAQNEVLDNGKPIWEARMDMDTVIGCLEFFGGVAPSIYGQHVKLPQGSFAIISKDPLGVVGGVGAWNYPLQTATWKIAPALACGNTFVYKPSPLTPLNVVLLAELFREAGLPDGVLNVVQGEGETGAYLTSHPDVAKISFTGSVPTGSKIMKSAADGIRNITLELGGKSPLVIFDDANLKNAVKGAMMANFFTQGQVCSNAARVFVQRGIYLEFLKAFVSQAKRMKIGDPFQDDTTVGATISEDHAQKVLGYIKSAVDEGAKVECGGERVSLEGELSGGQYLSPCVLTNCHDNMTAVREEIFGSVAIVLPFDSEEEVIRRANDTAFGLGGGVFTQNLNRAHRVSNALDAGSVWINTFNLTPSEVPFGGFKMSGIGRENGLAAIEHFTQTKTIYVEMNDVDCGQLYQE